MSSLALPLKAAPRRAGLRSRPWLSSRDGVDALLAVALMGLTAALLALLPSAFSVDSWLALATGREVWSAGVPHHEVLTVMSHGIPWIDQQWLSQLTMYGTYLLGGLGLVGVANTALFVLGAGGAVVAARKLGASPRSVLLLLPLCLWLIVPSHEVRTQEFAMPLFAATAYLLARDSRAPSRRVYWCLPILVLWGNLHGSVTLGALLVVLRGATVAVERRKLLLSSPRPWCRPLALALGATLCLLATPYGLSILSYYRTMFLGGTVVHVASEWQPVVSNAMLAAPFFLVAALAVWSVARRRSRTTPWEQLALLVLAAGSFEVIRNLLFFGLMALMVLPVALDGPARPLAERNGQPAMRGRGGVNAMLSGIVLAVVLLTGARALVRPASTIESHYQRTRILTLVEDVTRADPSVKVLTDDRFADWLLWRDPGLSGRIANDTRWELLTATQVNRLQALFTATGPHWRAGARGYRLLVLDKKHAPAATAALSADPGSRVLYDDGERVVILRGALTPRPWSRRT
ncbi:MAG: hypothetical protein M3071_11105 [Actinomycetota bacterium]|nr:hypothetical protein [Actinomycetota bacterium]